MNTDKYHELQKKVAYPTIGIKRTEPEKYRVMKEVYNKNLKEIYELFKKEALEEVGLTNHPKAEKIWEYAWREGHSGGFNDVFIILQDVAELFKEEKLCQ